MSTNRPFLRIAATYPTTDDGRLPDSIEVELDVNDAPLDEEVPVDDDEFPKRGFTRFVTEVVKALGNVAGTRPATINLFSAPGSGIEKLGELFGHAPGCDGNCDQPTAAQPVAVGGAEKGGA